MKSSKKNKTHVKEINLVPSHLYESVILIINKAEQIRHNALHHLFPSAKFTFLTLRTEKTDNSSGLNYTLHKSDFRIGILRNDRLKTLLKNEFDLLIDLSDHPKLSYFSLNINANLKAGCFNKYNNQHFNLFVENHEDSEIVLKLIEEQINKLTLNLKK